MSQQRTDGVWVDSNKFNEGQSTIPDEELRHYAGMHVAFSLDGTRILASGKTWDELYDNMDAAGIAGGQAVVSFVDLPGTVLLGGVALPLQADQDVASRPDPGRPLGASPAPRANHGDRADGD